VAKPSSLPAADRLLGLPAALWIALRDRLREIGFDSEGVRPILSAVRTPHPAWGRPMVVWHARQRGDVVARALRMLTLGDAVAEGEAKEVLGDVALDALVSTGLLERTGDGVVSPFRLGVAGQDYILSDDLAQDGDAVMGQSATTRLLVGGAVPFSKPVGRALDLGCGAGTLAILLAREGATVVATDVNPRAVLLTRVNARMAGLEGKVDVREGDLFAPVAGETFDLVVSQPPFMAKPEQSAPQTFLFGGRRGDEVAMRLLAELPAYVAEGGRALVLAEWPMVPGEPPVEVRVRQAVPGEDVDALFMLATRATPEEHSLGYAELRHPTLDEEYARTAMAFRSHLKDLGLAELHLVLHTFERAKGRRAFTSSLPVRAGGPISLTPAHIDRWMAARAIVARGPEAVLAARLKVTQGLSFAPPDAQRNILVQPDAGSFLEPLVVNEATAQLLVVVDGAKSVREAAETFAQATRTSRQDAEAKVAAAVSRSLLLGLLEPAT
jgi:SAM-dependent methyltransferase